MYDKVISINMARDEAFLDRMSIYGLQVGISSSPNFDKVSSKAL